MRTTLDLPDDVLRQAKIAAVERGSSLRQLVIDALARELGAAAPARRRMVAAPIRLAADAPLRSLSLQAVRLLDAEAVNEADLDRASALPR